MSEDKEKTLGLYEILKAGLPTSGESVDPSSLKYAIYARKSTTSDERQERSIQDQIDDCIQKVVIAQEGIRIVGEPIREQCSAKDPDIRPKFTQLLKDVRAGKIDGIIAWHPDRLSRNMREAGEIIDLLDKGVLKDLRFATSAFDNSPTGKMLLGISFVLSKQYSEHLSESVNRGNKSKIEAGYSLDKFKHGYYINDGRLIPDGNNFALIREAFQKRVNGESQSDIAEWLNKSSYTKWTKSNPAVPFVWKKNTISKLFKDPVNAGVLKYGDNLSRLEDFYDFEPTVSEEDFLKINKVDSLNSGKLTSSIMTKSREVTKANLLRGLVYCGHCNKKFSSGLVSKQLKDGKTYYYNYRCQTEGCPFEDKSVRANIVLGASVDFLEDHLFTTKANYDHFREEAKVRASELSREFRAKRMKLTKLLGDKNKEYERVKDLLSYSPDLKDHYSLKEMKAETEKAKDDLEEVNQLIKNLKGAYQTYGEYLELFESLPLKLRESSDMDFLDGMLRLFFSNFSVLAPLEGNKQGSKVTLELKEPWSGFVKNNEFLSGRAGWTMC